MSKLCLFDTISFPQITMINSLDIFKSLPIEDLQLEGNPFVKAFKDHDEYINAVRKKFPSLTKLDGRDFGPSINFDLVEVKKKLPGWKKLFLCNSSAQDLVANFIQQYFAIYDSDNRQLLLEAYHENAMISITATSDQNYTHKEM
jgi:nuclear RNA export factor